MRTRTTTSVVALSAVAFVLAGCSAPGPGADPDPSTASDSTFSAPAGPVPAGLEAFYTQNLQWESCDSYNTDGSELGDAVQCARVTVPLDYADPGGKTIDIAISRTQATGRRSGRSC